MDFSQRCIGIVQADADILARLQGQISYPVSDERLWMGETLFVATLARFPGPRIDRRGER
jgi:hypothetical protein